MFTSKDLKKLIIPLIFEQLLAVSVGFVDTFMVSIAGEAAVSGVALVDNISNLLIQILSALATGGAVVCSQYLGSKNIDMSKKSAGQLIFIMSTLSALLMVISLIGNHGIINFIFGKIEKDVFESASIYFYITAVSYPFLGVYNAGAALFRSIGNSKISMNTSLIMNIINICGNALFIFVFNMGVASVPISNGGLTKLFIYGSSGSCTTSTIASIVSTGASLHGYAASSQPACSSNSFASGPNNF